MTAKVPVTVPITKSPRLVIVTSEAPDHRVQNLLRSTLGCTEWPTSGQFAEDIFLHSISRLAPRFQVEEEIVQIIENQIASSFPVIVDAPVKYNHPIAWQKFTDRLAAERSEGVPEQVCLCRDGAAFTKAVGRWTKLLAIRAEDRLRDLLIHNVGNDQAAQVLFAWERQFKKLNAEPIRHWIIASLRHINRGAMIQSICSRTFDVSSCCLLGNAGSDLTLQRELEKRYGTRIPTLPDKLMDGKKTSLTIVVDSIQGGGQLLTKLRTHSDDLIKRGQTIRIVPCHATRHGIEVVEDEVDVDLRGLLCFDLTSSHVTENVDGTSSIPLAEITKRLQLMGCNASLSAQILNFLREIGQQLVIQNSQLTGVAPLGRRNLGLTTILDGGPGQGTLPILWLSSPPNHQVTWHSTTGNHSTEWTAIFLHHHDQAPSPIA